MAGVKSTKIIRSHLLPRTFVTNSGLLLPLLLLPWAMSQAHEFTVRNGCSESIWVGTFGDNDIPANGGFLLASGQSNSFQVIYKWLGGRIWARTGCDDNGQNCDTGDCGQAHCTGRTIFDAVSLAEFGLDNDAPPWYTDMDFWDISYVDGFNVPVTITPVPETVKPGDKCRQVSCGFDMSVCPDNFKQWGKNGQVAGCKSACSATLLDEYCCPDPPYNRETCPQPSDFSRIFKNQCYDACSWSYDDEQPIFSCQGNGQGASSYVIEFC